MGIPVHLYFCFTSLYSVLSISADRILLGHCCESLKSKIGIVLVRMLRGLFVFCFVDTNPTTKAHRTPRWRQPVCSWDVPSKHPGLSDAECDVNLAELSCMTPSVAMERVASHRIQEIPRSNLSTVTDTPGYEYSRFSSVPPYKCWCNNSHCVTIISVYIPSNSLVTNFPIPSGLQNL